MTRVLGESLLLKGNRSFCKAWKETEAGNSLRVASPASLIKSSFIFFLRKSEGPLPLGGHRKVREGSVWRQELRSGRVTCQGQRLSGFSLRLLREVLWHLLEQQDMDENGYCGEVSMWVLDKALAGGRADGFCLYSWCHVKHLLFLSGGGVHMKL